MTTKILFFIPSLELGGSERQLATLIEGIARQRAELVPYLRVLTMLKGNGPFAAPIRDLGIPVDCLNLHSTYDPRGPVRLRSYLRRVAPSAIHSSLAPANVVAGLARSKGTRVVWNFGNEGRNQARRNILGWATESISRIFARRADVVLCNAESVARYLHSTGFAEGQVHIIENGIDTVRFRPDATRRLETRTALGIEPEQILILGMGRSVPEKDWPTFVETVAELRRRNSAVSAIIAGGASEAERNAFEQMASDLGAAGCVRHLGPQSAPEGLLNACDVFLLASVHEGGPNVVLEALASGTLVAATAVGDVPLLLPATVLAPSGDPHALADAVERAIESPPVALPERYQQSVFVDRTLQVVLVE